jgi:hypothetical protein
MELYRLLGVFVKEREEVLLFEGDPIPGDSAYQSSALCYSKNLPFGV